MVEDKDGPTQSKRQTFMTPLIRDVALQGRKSAIGWHPCLLLAKVPAFHQADKSLVIN